MFKIIDPTETNLIQTKLQYSLNDPINYFFELAYKLDAQILIMYDNIHILKHRNDNTYFLFTGGKYPMSYMTQIQNERLYIPKALISPVSLNYDICKQIIDTYSEIDIF
jgi:predicted nucleic acid-binding protein